MVNWISETDGIFKISNTMEFARTWGEMKVNRNAEMNYEKMSRAMRYHYGNPSRKGHLAMVEKKRLVYRFGESAIRWRPGGNFTNILRKFFCTKVFWAVFLYLQFWFFFDERILLQKLLVKSWWNWLQRCQLHQHFKSSFSIQKCLALVSAYSLGLKFFVKRN